MKLNLNIVKIKLKRRKRLRKTKKILSTLLITTGTALAQGTEKPFVLEHILHKHLIDFVNATVYQQIDNYATVYNTSNIFAEFNITEKDLIFLNASITFGNGITYKTERKGYSLSPTADDLEDYLKDINGTGREYLLEAYYQKTLGKLTITGGLIDSTAFIDTNKYANDEHTQFLNSAFVNNPIALLPSYNPGIYLHYSLTEKISVSSVYMQAKPDSGNVGVIEVDYDEEKISLKGYYFYLFGGEENKGIGISGDYTLSDKSGFFFRGGCTNTDYRYFISGGFQINKIFFKDYSGLGCGFIKGKGVEDIKVCEVYYDVSFSPHLSLTLDLQYMDEIETDFIYGSRLYFSF